MCTRDLALVIEPPGVYSQRVSTSMRNAVRALCTSVLAWLPAGCSLLAPSVDELSGGGGTWAGKECAHGEKRCETVCVPADDPNYGCAAAPCDPCYVPNADPICEDGACAVGLCYSGLEDCNGLIEDGCEEDVYSSNKHCGACDISCETDQYCYAGRCAMGDCPDGAGDCNYDATDGCETDVTSSLDHCGTCGSPCILANATSVCLDSVCRVASCAAPWADCNEDGLDCETDTSTNKDNCGSCGTVCADLPNAPGVCAGSNCSVTCDLGWDDCNANLADGCETDVAADPSNCGGCGIACPSAPQADPACTESQCTFACQSLWGDCNGLPDDGCELKLTDVSHCGDCSTICHAANGTPGCSDVGTCTIESCESGYGDCDLEASTGCESALASDPFNCGACGLACPAPPQATGICSASTCGGWECSAGFADCDASSANGCEVDLQTDAGNCGACGRSCQGTPCTDGMCVPLALSSEAARHLVLDGAYVYYSTEDDIRRVPKAGGASQEISQSFYQLPSFLVVDETRVFWAEVSDYGSATDIGIVAAAKAPGSSPTLITMDSRARFFHLVDDRIYFPKGGTPAGIYWIPKDGGAATFVKDLGLGRGVFGDGVDLFVTRGTSLRRLTLADTSLTEIAVGTDMGSVLVDDASAFYREEPGIRKVPKVGGDIAPLVDTTDRDSTCAMAADDTRVYYAEPAAGRISAVPKAGGSPQILATGQTAPCSVAVDDTYVYWTDGVGVKRVVK